MRSFSNLDKIFFGVIFLIIPLITLLIVLHVKDVYIKVISNYWYLVYLPVLFFAYFTKTKFHNWLNK